MSSRKTKGKQPKKRAQRATSNVFAMFDQAQIQEFKEAFNMIDQNRDGFIDKEDLHDMLASLGIVNNSSHSLLKYFISFKQAIKFIRNMIFFHGKLPNTGTSRQSIPLAFWNRLIGLI